MKASNDQWRNTQWLKKVKYKVVSLNEAKALLGNGLDHDRIPKALSIQHILECMKTGDAWWPYSPSQTPIMISDEGKRLNGQTRLIAYVQYLTDGGTPLEFPILTEVPIEVFEYIDTGGRPRTAYNALHDREGVTRDTARVNWLHALLVGNKFYTAPVAVLRSKLEDQYAKQITWAAETFPGSGKFQRSPYVVPFMYAFMVDPKFATEIGKAWKDGQPLPTPLLRLRDAALGTNGRQKSSGKLNMKGGGRSYTHEDTTFKILNILADLHQGKALASKTTASSTGFKYWSDRRKDGAWANYVNQTGAEKAEITASLLLDED